MTLRPCPLCGKAPRVEAHRSDIGKLWTASCECYATHSYDRERLERLWAKYCDKMAEEGGA